MGAEGGTWSDSQDHEEEAKQGAIFQERATLLR